MRILIDILHPAHVHFFRNFREEMIGLGHEVLVTARDKDVAVDLLEDLGIPHTVLSAQRYGTLGLGGELLRRSARLIKVARRFRPAVMTGIMGPSIAPVGKMLRIPSVVFYDTEFATKTNRFVYPLATFVCTPDSYSAGVNGNHVTYPGYHELAYLHPKRFRPDPAKLHLFGVDPGEAYSIVRFVSWKASHDTREVAMSLEQKHHVIDQLSSFGRVMISSESPLPPSLRDRSLSGPITEIHHLLAFARVVFGESATMSSEAAVLGTPAVFVASTGRGYTDDQERRYGLVRFFQPHSFEAAVGSAKELARMSPQSRSQKRQHLLAEKLDVTAWMVEFFEGEFRG